MGKINRAVVSVSEKQGLGEFAKVLADLGVEILSTGGTAKSLREQGIHVVDVSEYTGFPEMMEGRVKTLHPKVHGGILGDRSKEDHRSQMKAQGIEPIDMVVVNLYPFKQTIAQAGVTPETARTNIDIGGPCMVRASAKNYLRVASVTDPADYGKILAELRGSGGRISLATRFALMQKAFRHTADYDTAIADYFARTGPEDVEACYRV